MIFMTEAQRPCRAFVARSSWPKGNGATDPAAPREPQPRLPKREEAPALAQDERFPGVGGANA
jgi:hypothetical protein